MGWKKLVSSIAHAAIAVATQITVYFAFKDPISGGLFWAGWFCGREHKEAEYHLIEDHYFGSRKLAGGWRVPFKAFHPKFWNLDGILDAVLPIVAVVVVWLILR